MSDEATAHVAGPPATEDSAPAAVVAPVTSETTATDASAGAAVEDTTSAKPTDEPTIASDIVNKLPIHKADKPAITLATEKTEHAAPADPVPTNGASTKAKKEKRKSTGVPEHKTNKKLSRKKSMPALHLDVEPGSLWFVQMKGYPPWPAVICDEEMLPVTLLGRRPVSAKQADGSYRADFAEGGKNAKDRKYPVMFLGTNEFAWQVNTDLAPLDVEEMKKVVDSDERGKKNKDLWNAYQVAAQNHDLDHFKTMLAEHEENARKRAEELAAKEAEKAAKAAKKKAKDEKAADDDADMKDADDDEPAKPKSSSKKRKKEAAEIEGETPKPSKTPKLKVNGPKELGDESATKKKSSAKPKKSAKKEAEEVKTPSSPPLTEEERRERRERMVLYLRHKLQKGFLTRDQTPKEDEMVTMDEQFKNLEKLTDLDAGIIRATKIHKVLKAILKLEHIPKEHEYHFKDRSAGLLNVWAPALGLDGEAAAPAANGIKHDETASENKNEEPASEKPSEPIAEMTEDVPEAKEVEGGDIAMPDASKEAEAAPAA